MEAIKIQLTGNVAKYYDVYYRVYLQNFGWLDWAKNGEATGSMGYSYRLEGIEIRTVKKGSAAPGSTSVILKQTNLRVKYASYVQNIGLQNYVKNGEFSGTTGKSYRLEGIKIYLDNNSIGGGIQYQTHIQNIGWQNWVGDNTLGGTKGKSLRMEAIRIRLTGRVSSQYDVYYRVYAQNFGWLGWAKNGASAGTSGYSYRLEGIEIRLVEKGKKGPTSTIAAYRTK